MEKKDEIQNILNSLESDDSAAGGQEPLQEGTTSPSPQERGDGVSVEDLQRTLTTKTEEVQSLQDRYLRLAAEFENYKKLALRDQREHVRFANERLLKEFLPVIDNLERAIQSGKDGPAGTALLQGVELTLKQALESFARFGLQPMDTVGQPFNPAWHQAVMKVESTAVPEDSVVEEFQRGYFLHDRVLRPAMVSVASGSDSAHSEAFPSEGPPDEASPETSDGAPR